VAATTPVFWNKAEWIGAGTSAPYQPASELNAPITTTTTIATTTKQIMVIIDMVQTQGDSLFRN